MGRSMGWKRRTWALSLAVSTAAGMVVGGGVAQAADPVPTVFIGDSYTSNFGIAPLAETAPPRFFCFQTQENYPATANRRLAERGVTLQVQADRSCGSATIRSFWEEQAVFPALPDMTVPPQQEAITQDTRLVVGSMGGNTLGFANILKQCSERLRGEEGLLLPAQPVDEDSPAAGCRQFFESGDGADWLAERLEVVAWDLEEMFDRVAYFSGEQATTILVGYPRLVPEDESRCRSTIPGSADLPFADIDQTTLDFLDSVQARLNTVMATTAAEHGARFVDLYAATANNTACDGAERGIGGLLEPSQVTLGETALPWYAHPNPHGRDIQAQQVADQIDAALNG